MAIAAKLVVLTRTEAGNRTWATYLTHQGIETYSLPTIETGDIHPTPELMRALQYLQQFDWIVFTSATGVRHATDLFARYAPPGSHLPATAVMGEQTAAAARKAGFHVAFRPSRASAAVLGEELAPIKDKRILLLRTSIATRALAGQLRARGASVTDLAAYQTRLVTGIDAAFSQMLHESRILGITFASPSAVDGFIQRVGQSDLMRAQTLPAIAAGPSVAAALRQHGFISIREAVSPDIRAIHQAILQLSEKV